jgi:hypothetical protein
MDQVAIPTQLINLRKQEIVNELLNLLNVNHQVPQSWKTAICVDHSTKIQTAMTIMSQISSDIGFVY